MKSRWVIALSGVTTIILVGVVTCAWRSGRLVYEGKSLNTWLEVYHDASEHSDSAARDQSIASIRKLGADVIPVLLRDIRAQDPDWKKKLLELVADQSWIHLRFTTASDRKGRALEGFAALQSSARPAIPQLSQILDDPGTDQETAQFVVLALGGIGSDAIPVLTGALTHPDPVVRYDAAMAFLSMDQITPLCVDQLLQSLQDVNSAVRFEAAMALAHFRKKPQVVVPFLIELLRTPGNHNRRHVAYALSDYGEAAGAAVPFLLELIDEPVIQDATRWALMRIDPAGAATGAAVK